MKDACLSANSGATTAKAGSSGTAPQVGVLGHALSELVLFDSLLVGAHVGVYGASKGLTSSLCSGPCAAGHYCPEGSVNATQHRCPAGRYGECIPSHRASSYDSSDRCCHCWGDRRGEGAEGQLLQRDLQRGLPLRRGLDLAHSAGVRRAGPPRHL